MVDCARSARCPSGEPRGQWIELDLLNIARQQTRICGPRILRSCSPDAPQRCGKHDRQAASGNVAHIEDRLPRRSARAAGAQSVDDRRGRMKIAEQIVAVVPVEDHIRRHLRARRVKQIVEGGTECAPGWSRQSLRGGSGRIKRSCIKRPLKTSNIERPGDRLRVKTLVAARISGRNSDAIEVDPADCQSRSDQGGVDAA